MFVSVSSRGLDMLLDMARAPRQRRWAVAAAVAVMAIALMVVPVAVVASDGVSHSDENALWQGWSLELTLLAGWLLLSAASLSLLGLRPREADDYLFARVPGARLWLAYLISLFWTGMAAVVVVAPLSAALSTLQDLSDVDGRREAFGWLFIRTVFYMVGGLFLGGIGLVVAVVMLAVVSSIAVRRGTAAKGEAAGARYLVGILVLLLLVAALPISLYLPDTPARRLTAGLTWAGLVGLTFAVLLGIGQIADRRAKAAGTPNWTTGLVRTGFSPEGYAAAVGIVMATISWIAVAASGVDLQGAEVLFACNLTDCSSIGVTVAGWLIVALPFFLILMAAAFWPRLGRAAKIALTLTSLLLCGNGALFFPIGKSTFSDLVTGPGSGLAIGGIGWAGAGVAVAAVWCLAAFILGKTTLPALRRRTAMVAPSLALLLIALAVAIVRAEPSIMRAEVMFPATLKMNGDTLTRTMVRNQPGCDGILPDDTRLNVQECLLTVHATYTTDDSDAVVTIRATNYRDLTASRTVHNGLTDQVRPTGVTGEVITDTFASFNWVVIVTAGHADGRPIQPDEQSWVRWPLRQVSIHFINNWIGGSGEPKPNPSFGPKAAGRTPCPSLCGNGLLVRVAPPVRPEFQ